MKVVGSFETSVTSLLTTTGVTSQKTGILTHAAVKNVKPRICAIHGALSEILTLAGVGDCYDPEGQAYGRASVYIYIYIYVKGKVRPRTGHEGPEEDRGIALLFL